MRPYGLQMGVGLHGRIKFAEREFGVSVIVPRTLVNDQKTLEITKLNDIVKRSEPPPDPSLGFHVRPISPICQRISGRSDGNSLLPPRKHPRPPDQNGILFLR